MASIHSAHRRAMPSLIMLVSKPIWDERNAQVFHGHYALTFILLQAIEQDYALGLSGGKALGSLLAGRVATCFSSFDNIRVAVVHDIYPLPWIEVFDDARWHRSLMRRVVGVSSGRATQLR